MNLLFILFDYITELGRHGKKVNMRQSEPAGITHLTAFYISKSLENISIPNKAQYEHLKTQDRLEEILMSYFNQFNDKLIVNKLVNFLKFFKPEIKTSKHRKNCSHRQHVVKVSDDIVSIRLLSIGWNN